VQNYTVLVQQRQSWIRQILVAQGEESPESFKLFSEQAGLHTAVWLMLNFLDRHIRFRPRLTGFYHLAAFAHVHDLGLRNQPAGTPLTLTQLAKINTELKRVFLHPQVQTFFTELETKLQKLELETSPEASR